MQLGRVLGHAVATIKHPTLSGWRLLVVQPLGMANRPDGDPVLAIDSLGAGRGHIVILSNDGKGARELVGAHDSPARWTILGLCDEIG